MNGQQQGEAYVSVFKAYLLEGHALPRSEVDGTLNLAELARLTGIPKTSFYQNSTLVGLLEEALDEQGVSRRGMSKGPGPAEQSVAGSPSSAEEEGPLRSEVLRLQQRLAASWAEIANLRKENRALRLKFGREDMMIETGRRVASTERK